MPRYEFSEGASNKFWQIELTGTSFTTTFGKIGTAGQSSTKAFDSEAKAALEYNKLVAEKTKKGYRLVAAGVVSAAPTPTTAHLPPPPAAPPRPSLALTPAVMHAAEKEIAAHAAAPRKSDNPVGRWITDVYGPFCNHGKKGVQDGVNRGNADAERLSRAVLKEYGSLETMPKSLNVETAAAALQLLVLAADCRNPSDALIDFWVAHSGLGFALEAFVTSLWSLDTWYSNGLHQPGVAAGAAARWLAPTAQLRGLQSLFNNRADRVLQGHWQSADQAQRIAVRSHAETLRTTGTLLQRSAIASCLLDQPWIDDDLRLHATTGEPAMFSPEALLIASSAADITTYMSKLRQADHDFYDATPIWTATQHGHVAGGTMYAQLQRFGLAGIDLLCARATATLKAYDPTSLQGLRYGRSLHAFLEALRLAHNYQPVAAVAIAIIEQSHNHKLSKDDDPRPLAFECLRNSPALALPLVQDAAKNKGGKWAKALLPQLARLAGASADDDRLDANASELPTALLQSPLKFKAPDFWQPTALPRIELHTGSVLPVAHLDALAAALKADDQLVLDAVKAIADAQSLAEFGWEVFTAWLTSGAPSKEKWAFAALGQLGTDDTARRITPLIRAWPGESQHARAVLGLDVLGAIGSDVALMMLNGIAQKVKFKGLQERAREKMNEIAAKRGMTAEQLADRLVPDLDLEDNGSITLDFGPRSFRVGFDESLSPFVVDATGTRLKDLPKPNSKDDAALSADASETWKAMKKDVRTLANIQITRLELAMGNARRWSADEFRKFFVEHPLLTHLVRRLVWGVYVPASTVAEADTLRGTFRVAEDRSYADQHDDTFTLPPDAVVGIAHRLHLTQAEAATWGKVYADYEIAQPFEQLARTVFTLSAAEQTGAALTRFAGRVVETKKLLGLLSRGWRKGEAQDAGCIFEMYKMINPGLFASLPFAMGLNAGSMDYVDPTQTLGIVAFASSNPSWPLRPNQILLTAIDDVTLSEVIRDIESLGAVAQS
ncbi:MAG: DUF4132 domain-containing protein [Kofleriaceae bacterium]|nr:DUF4132 domain-containing protein [Kofleriaceae bacterium]